MILTPVLAALLLAPGGEADPTRPTMVALDFRDLPVAEVVRAIGERSGQPIALQGPGGRPVGFDRPGGLRLVGEAPRVSLEWPEPVPFWEAVDRLCAAAQLERIASPEGGPLTRHRPPVALSPTSGPAAARGPEPAAYAGPFRIGRLTLHRESDRLFVPPAKPPTAGPGPFWVEFPVRSEPRVLAIRTGAATRLEAIDDRGRSLVDPSLAGRAGRSARGHEFFGDVTVQVPLAGPDDPGRTLRTLRGVIPLEVATLPAEPELDIPLAGTSGKTFRAGDASLLIREFSVDQAGRWHLKVTARVVGERGDPAKAPRGVLAARASLITSRLLEIVTDQGVSPSMSQGGAANGPEVLMDYHLSTPAGPGKQPPAVRLRLYAPRWVAWELPFEFADVPLP